MNNRIIYSDNGTLSDFSTDLANYHAGTGTMSFVAAEDAIYIGTYIPINHLYCKVGGIVNSQASVIIVSPWNGSAFVSAAEVIDETSVAGASLAQSGFISWVTDKNELWGRDDTVVSGAEKVTGLGSITIYDRYWLKLTFSADLTASVVLSWVGHLFSDDNSFASEFPDLMRSSNMTSFESGKTDWEEQHVVAAKQLINDIIYQRKIDMVGQILDRRDYELAVNQKVAEIIYTAFGDDYIDQKTEARKEYSSRLNKLFPKVDLNKNARYDVQEQIKVRGKLMR